MVKRAVVKALRSTGFEVAVEQGMHKLVFETHIFDAVATHAADALTFTVSVGMFVKKEIEKCSFVQAQWENDTRS